MPRQSHSDDIFNNDETDSQLSTNYNTSDEDESYATTKSPTKKSSRHLPPSRNAANARERARMRVLARAFCRLKTTLPWVPADTKLSKLDTLRLATSYIAYLREVLIMDEEKQMEIQRERDGGIKKHPVTMSWPFNFGTTSTTSTADRFTNMSITSNHLKPASLNSKNLSDCRSILNSTNNQQIKTSLRASDSWEVGNGSDNEFPAGIADQNQLMSCQQRGDKDIEVSYY